MYMTEENQCNNQQLENNVLSKKYICDTCENQVIDVIQHTSHENSTNVNHHCHMTTDQLELPEDHIALECRENLTGSTPHSKAKHR